MTEAQDVGNTGETLSHKMTTHVRDGITLHEITKFGSKFLSTKFKIDVYLPPGFDAMENMKLPLLLLNDGQDMLRVQLAKTLHRLFFGKKIPPIIVVAIHAANRMHEYGTAGQPDYKGRGSLAGRYAKFIATELLPFLWKNYPCETNPEKVTFGGFSLGGLSALDIVWNYPQHFGSVGVFSGSLWWRHSEFVEGDPDAHRIMHEIVQEDEIRPGLRFWFQTGTLDEKADRNNNGVIDSIDDTLDLIAELKNKGYSDADIHYREVEGGHHNPTTWGQVMPEFLEWCFSSVK